MSTEESGIFFFFGFTDFSFLVKNNVGQEAKIQAVFCEPA